MTPESFSWQFFIIVWKQNCRSSLEPACNLPEKRNTHVSSVFLITLWHYLGRCSGTAQKMKLSIKDFFSKCDKIRSKLRIWSHFLKKSLMEIFIFCAVWISNRSSLLHVFYKKGALKNIAKFTGKQLHWSLFLIFWTATACTFIEKEALARVIF